MRARTFFPFIERCVNGRQAHNALLLSPFGHAIYPTTNASQMPCRPLSALLPANRRSTRQHTADVIQQLHQGYREMAWRQSDSQLRLRPQAGCAPLKMRWRPLCNRRPVSQMYMLRMPKCQSGSLVPGSGSSTGTDTGWWTLHYIWRAPRTPKRWWPTLHRHIISRESRNLYKSGIEGGRYPS